MAFLKAKTKAEHLEYKYRTLLRKKNKTVIVNHDDGDGNWLVSYADMMTLLFGFFVMLSAFSTPNAEKFEKLKEKTSESMGSKYVKPYSELSKGITQVLKDIQLEKEISIKETFEGVTISSKGTLFFESGAAELKPQAQELMEKISVILSKQAVGFRIIVEGHTDDSPIVGTKSIFPSNWELSSARAGSVVRLLEGKGIQSVNLRPVGLAHIEPLLPNRKPDGTIIPENQAENRRIVIRLQKQLPSRMSK